MLTVGSLFSGIGGIDLGLERAGMTISWQVEIDAWCRRVLAMHWPDVPKYGDITEIEALPYVDLICGGFPCQPVSLAGEGKAQDDERWLWPEFERIIRLVRPRYVLVENVPGLLARGRGFDAVLGGLAALGFDAEWQVLSAAALGACQIRERVWLLAYPAPMQRQAIKWDESHGVLSTNVPDAHKCGRNGRAGVFGADGWKQPPYRDWWASEPSVDRMAYGIPNRVDRLRGLGNAVVPQVVEYIGWRIMEHVRSEVST